MTGALRLHPRHLAATGRRHLPGCHRPVLLAAPQRPRRAATPGRLAVRQPVPAGNCPRSSRRRPGHQNRLVQIPGCLADALGYRRPLLRPRVRLPRPLVDPPQSCPALDSCPPRHLPGRHRRFATHVAPAADRAWRVGGGIPDSSRRHYGGLRGGPRPGQCRCIALAVHPLAAASLARSAHPGRTDRKSQPVRCSMPPICPGRSTSILSSIGVLLVATTYAIALFGFQIFDPRPTARRAALEQMRDGVVVFDPEWRVAGLNRATAAILGTPAARARGKTIGRNPAGARRLERCFGT